MVRTNKLGCSSQESLFTLPGNTKRGSITVPLTSCWTGLESAVWQLTIFVFICKTDQSKPVKQEVNGTVMLPPLVFLDSTLTFGGNAGPCFSAVP